MPHFAFSLLGFLLLGFAAFINIMDDNSVVRKWAMYLALLGAVCLGRGI